MSNRIFLPDVPLQVVQNIVTALEPDLLTEHTLMLLVNDLSRLLPLEELPHRMLHVVTEMVVNDEQDDDDGPPEPPPTH